jgi:hypothetical protein
MPTDHEIEEYGARLPIWDQIRLFQEWAPLIGFAQRFTVETDNVKRSLVVADALEWLASKTHSPLDDELVKHVAAVARTPEGEALVRWALSKVGAQ